MDSVIIRYLFKGIGAICNQLFLVTLQDYSVYGDRIQGVAMIGCKSYGQVIPMTNGNRSHRSIESTICSGSIICPRSPICLGSTFHLGASVDDSDTDMVGVSCPLSIEYNHAIFFRGQVPDILLIGIVTSCPIGTGIPSGKGVALSGVGIGCQMLCHIEGEELILHGTLHIFSIWCKLYLVGVGNPSGIQMDILRNLLIPVIEGGPAGVGIPAAKGISHPGDGTPGQLAAIVHPQNLIRHMIRSLIIEADQGKTTPFPIEL